MLFPIWLGVDRVGHVGEILTLFWRGTCGVYYDTLGYAEGLRAGRSYGLETFLGALCLANSILTDKFSLLVCPACKLWSANIFCAELVVYPLLLWISSFSTFSKFFPYFYIPFSPWFCFLLQAPIYVALAYIA